jgi:putative MATE family efflux protein
VEKPDKDLNRRERGNLTKGSPARVLVMFAFPILFGAFLQQLYTAVDTVMVGHFVGKNALGAVGVTVPVINLLGALFMGLSSGSLVIIANFFGKRDNEKLSRAIHTTICLAVVVGVVIAVLGLSFSGLILKMMGTPREVFRGALVYMMIFFVGMPAVAIYNIGASTLQAVGNSKTPLMFLVLSTILNIVFDFVFVAIIPLGVAGVAVSTVIAEVVSAGGIICVMLKTKREYRLSIKKLKIDPAITKQILRIGIPGAVQTCIISVSNVAVMSYVSGLGAVALSGFSVTSRVEAFLPLPLAAMGLATSTFVSQNLGAGEVRRAKQSVWIAAGIGASITAILIVFTMIFHEFAFKIFTTDPQVLHSAWEFARIVMPFYVVLTFTNILPAAMRGAGKVNFATFASIFCFVILRQIYLGIVTNYAYNPTIVSLGYSFTWTLCATAIVIYFFSTDHLANSKITRIHIVHTSGTNTDFVKLCYRLDEEQNKLNDERRRAGLNSVYNTENLKDVFILYDGKKAIGTASLWQHDPETCEIIRVFVEPKYSSQNLAKSLVAEVQTLAKTLGYKYIHVRTFRNQAGGVGDFEKIGFSPIDPTEFQYVDKYPAALALAPSRVYMRMEIF